MSLPLAATRRYPGRFLRCCLPLLLLVGCKQDPEQVAVVQAMATALVRRAPAEKRTESACASLVAEQQNPMGCDNVLVPLLHYAPGFPGSKVARRGASHRALWGKNRPSVVPLHYQGPRGQGDLDATMLKEDGKWRVFSLLPVK